MISMVIISFSVILDSNKMLSILHVQGKKRACGSKENESDRFPNFPEEKI